MKITHIYECWKWLESKPFGHCLFNYIVRYINPYTGSLKANVICLKSGYAKLELKDRRSIRNHLHSIHAIALTNLGEFTSGLALISLLSEEMRGIPVEINAIFTKKARGRLVAECNTQLPVFDIECEHIVNAEIRDEYSDIVAIVNVKWKIGLIQK